MVCDGVEEFGDFVGGEGLWDSFWFFEVADFFAVVVGPFKDFFEVEFDAADFGVDAACFCAFLLVVCNVVFDVVDGWLVFFAVGE